MEKVINKLAEVKKDLIQYIIESAETNKLSYLFTDFCDVDKVKLYHIGIDDKFFITEDIEYRLNTFNIELLAEFANKVQKDLNKVLNYDTLHDYQLVNQINECYQHNEKRFLEILQLIAQREKEKIYKLFGYNIEVNDIDCIRFIVRDILTHICDDKDLECIILYCKKS